MVELTTEQRGLLADKLPDVANIAAGALVFGQSLSDRTFSWPLAAAGVALWAFLFGCAVVLAGGDQS
jgi:hypothetical protein